MSRQRSRSSRQASGIQSAVALPHGLVARAGALVDDDRRCVPALERSSRPSRPRSAGRPTRPARRARPRRAARALSGDRRSRPRTPSSARCQSSCSPTSLIETPIRSRTRSLIRRSTMRFSLSECASPITRVSLSHADVHAATLAREPAGARSRVPPGRIVIGRRARRGMRGGWLVVCLGCSSPTTTDRRPIAALLWYAGGAPTRPSDRRVGDSASARFRLRPTPAAGFRRSARSSGRGTRLLSTSIVLAGITIGAPRARPGRPRASSPPRHEARPVRPPEMRRPRSSRSARCVVAGRADDDGLEIVLVGKAPRRHDCRAAILDEASDSAADPADARDPGTRRRRSRDEGQGLARAAAASPQRPPWFDELECRRCSTRPTLDARSRLDAALLGRARGRHDDRSSRAARRAPRRGRLRRQLGGRGEPRGQVHDDLTCRREDEKSRRARSMHSGRSSCSSRVRAVRGRCVVGETPAKPRRLRGKTMPKAARASCPKPNRGEWKPASSQWTPIVARPTRHAARRSRVVRAAARALIASPKRRRAPRCVRCPLSIERTALRAGRLLR